MKRSRGVFPSASTQLPRREAPAMADDARPKRPRLLIVAGSSLRAEEVDRPLAYYLKQEIEAKNPDFGPVLVISDLRWLQDDDLQALPTISVGGPAVNAVAYHWLEDLPVSLAVDERYYIQMDPDLDEARVSLWGMDNATTQIAASAFVRRFLPRFLDHCVTLAEPIDLDDEADDDDDDEPDV